MALVKTFNGADLKREFEAWDRDYYSLDACEKIVELFEECGGNVELDIVGLCGDFNEYDEDYIKSEYSNIEEIADAETTEELLDALNCYTWAVETSDGILYQTF